MILFFSNFQNISQFDVWYHIKREQKLCTSFAMNFSAHSKRPRKSFEMYSNVEGEGTLKTGIFSWEKVPELGSDNVASVTMLQ